MRQFELDSSLWSYEGEGGKHVLFSSPKYPQRLLRVQRDFLVMSVHRRRSSSSSSRSSGSRNSTSATSNTTAKSTTCPIVSAAATSTWTTTSQFIQWIIHPRFSQYHDIPEWIPLSKKDAKRLYQIAMTSNSIPSNRISYWTTVSIGPNTNEHFWATLLCNYRFTMNPYTISTSSLSCYYYSLELKPKAGYITTSPFVHPRNRQKYQMPRFFLKQQQQQQHQNLNTSQTKSRYNPMDLFSMSEERMEIAIEALLDCPRNNLQIWNHSQCLVYGQNVRILSEETVRHLLHILILTLRQQKSSPGGNENECLLLRRIQNWQRLDILDGEGVIWIYHHLLQHYHPGSDMSHDTNEKRKENEHNETMEFIIQHHIENITPYCLRDIQSLPDIWDEDDIQHHQLLETSPFRRPDSPSLDRFLSLLSDYARQMDGTNIRSQQSISMEESEYRSLCQSLISSLTTDDCIYLLRNWLLSLTMCDVSIMVRLTNVPQREFTRLQVPTDTRFMDCHQTDETWWYSIKLIDCDNKPAQKISTRHTKEKLNFGKVGS